MKVIAYILVGSLLVLGMNRFVEHMDEPVSQIDMLSDMDCCASHDGYEDKEDSNHQDHECPPGCDCDCCFQIVAIEYQFINNAVVATQSFFFGTYSNRYRFEYFTPLLEPPRFS